ncbi:MAG TPA: hypothetical protein PKV27_02980 [Ilumatobacteraceae bacterium]|nr:hypothetical protein [Ilumatobacteraceae bacterium]
MNDSLPPEPLPDGLPEVLRGALRDADAPSTGRESAIAAAMATFDQIHTGATVIDLQQRRRRSTRVLSIAAAVVVVVGAALAIRSLTGDSGEKSVTAIQASEARQTDQSVAKSAAPAVAPAASTEERVGGAASDAKSESSTDAATDAATNAGQAPTAMSAVLAAESPAELADLYRQIRQQTADPSIQLDCLPEDSVAVARILYQGRDAVLVETGPRIQALAASDCTTLATANP